MAVAEGRRRRGDDGRRDELEQRDQPDRPRTGRRVGVQQDRDPRRELGDVEGEVGEQDAAQRGAGEHAGQDVDRPRGGHVRPMVPGPTCRTRGAGSPIWQRSEARYYGDRAERRVRARDTAPARPGWAMTTRPIPSAPVAAGPSGCSLSPSCASPMRSISPSVGCTSADLAPACRGSMTVPLTNAIELSVGGR